MKNPTRGEKQAYKEKIQRGQGMSLDPKESNEIQKEKRPSLERDEERRLDGSKNLQYRGYDRGLGDPSTYDDYGEDSQP